MLSAIVNTPLKSRSRNEFCFSSVILVESLIWDNSSNIWFCLKTRWNQIHKWRTNTLLNLFCKSSIWNRSNSYPKPWFSSSDELVFPDENLARTAKLIDRRSKNFCHIVSFLKWTTSNSNFSNSYKCVLYTNYWRCSRLVCLVLFGLPWMNKISLY